ncbi:MauE/DoxX family redox-associated membrane protein [Streptomyces sp. NPDC052107]|uniref:MauE/DoxX family redox-associated membrane protein n=1 Tax=Streptomyces sp. NPDC052107 TaxID=3155632 RepID=UPI003415A579
MIPVVTDLAPLVCGLLLALTGVRKLFGRGTAQLAANTVLVRVLGGGRRATFALRSVGGLELALGVALLAVPVPVVPGVATAALGVGFAGYLAYAKATAPESSCGCSVRAEGPIGVRSFARAWLVVIGGLMAATAHTAWWPEITGRPVASAAFLLVATALLTAVSSDLDHLWLMPLRKSRIRAFGNPLPSSAGERVPIEATVELLERSAAWQSVRPVVRSALLEHWDDGAWRVLRYSGTYRDSRDIHPVSVLFALDLTASLDTTPSPAVRVSLVDEATEEVLPADVLTFVPLRKAFPLAT